MRYQNLVALGALMVALLVIGCGGGGGGGTSTDSSITPDREQRGERGNNPDFTVTETPSGAA